MEGVFYSQTRCAPKHNGLCCPSYGRNTPGCATPRFTKVPTKRPSNRIPPSRTQSRWSSPRRQWPEWSQNSTEGLGLGADIVERARSLLGEGAGSIDELLKSVEARARSLEEAEVRAEQARREADQARADAERSERRLQREIEEVRARARQELLEEIHAARDQARKLVAELQRAARVDNVGDAMRAANQAADQIRELEAEQEAKLDAVAPAAKPSAASAQLDGVRVGQWVHVPKLGRDGEVIALDGRDAQVAVGSMKLRVPQKSLRPPAGPRPQRASAKTEAKRSVTKRVAETSEAIVEEIDVRGHSVEESIDRLEAFLDYHYGRPTTQVRVIHGHGTGVLREALREHLRRSGYVRSLRPGEQDEGGDGVTVVHLT